MRILYYFHIDQAIGRDIELRIINVTKYIIKSIDLSDKDNTTVLGLATGRYGRSFSVNGQSIFLKVRSGLIRTGAVFAGLNGYFRRPNQD